MNAQTLELSLTIPPEQAGQRLDQALAALLPDEGTDIKGQMQPGEQLRNASELTRRDFESLIDILDGELRLITPVSRYCAMIAPHAHDAELSSETSISSASPVFSR